MEEQLPLSVSAASPPGLTLIAGSDVIRPLVPACRLVREYLDSAPSSAVEDAIDTLSSTGGSVLKMVHTHDGAAAACMMLAYGSAKDRKRLVKVCSDVCLVLRVC